MTRSGQDVLRFTLYGAVIPPLLSAALGAGALSVGEHLARPEAIKGYRDLVAGGRHRHPGGGAHPGGGLPEA